MCFTCDSVRLREVCLGEGVVKQVRFLVLFECKERHESEVGEVLNHDLGIIEFLEFQTSDFKACNDLNVVSYVV